MTATGFLLLCLAAILAALADEFETPTWLESAAAAIFCGGGLSLMAGIATWLWRAAP